MNTQTKFVVPDRIDLVVFDIAGTTVNDRTPAGDAVNLCLRQAIEAAGVPVTRDAVNVVMGIQKPEAIRRLLIGAGREDMVGRVDVIHGDFVARMKRFYTTDPAVYPVAGAVDCFVSLRKAGIRIALDTGFSRDITALILDRLGWRDGEAIDASICSDEVAQGRPAPDMIRSLMGRLGVTDVRRVTKVGDTPADLHEGTNTGCGLVIGVTGGTHTPEQMLPHPHTHLIRTVGELPELLAGLGLMEG